MNRDKAISDIQSGSGMSSSRLPLFLLTLVLILNAVDRQLVAVLAEPIKHDLGLTDGQLGLLTGMAFAIFYTIFGIPLAWLADRVNRVKLIAVACVTWSIMSILCGQATNFVHLLLARIGVGIGEAGGSPPSYSLISDYYPPERRGSALASFTLGIPIGLALATAVGGWVGAQFGWRAAFLACGLPGIALALVLVIVLREPLRGRFDRLDAAADATSLSLWRTIKDFFGNPVLALVALGGSASVFGSHAVLAWLPAYLIRSKDMSLEQIAAYYSLVSGAGMMIGIIVAGRVADWLTSRSPERVLLIPAAACLVAWPMLTLVIGSQSWQLALVFSFFLMTVFWMYQPVSVLVIQNTVHPSQRATASAIFLFVIGIIGIGGGASVTGFVSDVATARYGEEGLGIALLALLPAFVAAAIAFFGATRFWRRQLARVNQAELKVEPRM